jgi:hypothetical protein
LKENKGMKKILFSAALAAAFPLFVCASGVSEPAVEIPGESMTNAPISCAPFPDSNG